MINTSSIREELWRAIQAHYERSDYTEAIRDALFHACEVLREKSGIEDKDGVSLVEAALLGKNPAVLINKNETTTEKNIQQGIGFSFKGIMMSVRNPISHETYKYTEEEAETIIRYINYLLNHIDKSGGKTKISVILELLNDEDFTDTKEYAELLLKEIPANKRYDLLLTLFNQRESLPKNKLHYFISDLFASLSKNAKSDFVMAANSSLMKCKDDMKLRMYFHYFMIDTYESLKRLVQLRIENLILKSVRNGKMENVDESGVETKKWCNDGGSLSTWISDKLDYLGNKEEIVEELFYKLEHDRNEQEFVLEFFADTIAKDANEFSMTELFIIRKALSSGNDLLYKWAEERIELFPMDGYADLFGVAYEKCKEKLAIQEEEDLPF